MSSFPVSGSIAWKIGQYIFEHGAITMDRAREVADSANFLRSLDAWISSNWFYVNDESNIELTRTARRHMEHCAPPKAEKYKGEIVPPSSLNLLNRKPYRTPKTVRRQDIPDWSIRPADFTYKTAGGGEP